MDITERQYVCLLLELKLKTALFTNKIHFKLTVTQTLVIAFILITQSLRSADMLPEANTDRTAIRLDELYSRLGLETFWMSSLIRSHIKGQDGAFGYVILISSLRFRIATTFKWNSVLMVYSTRVIIVTY